MPTGGPLIPKMPPSSWVRGARCAEDGVDPDDLMPTDWEGEESDRIKESRNRLCLGLDPEGGKPNPCPVISECLDWALATRQPTGVWGGLLAPDREALLTGQRRTARRRRRPRRLV